MTQRNIIFFHAESWDGRMLGAMGHPALCSATPHIDHLVGDGTLFENTYCSHPICCPSRANMWSGRYTHHCESWNNHKGLEPGMWALLDHLPQTHRVGIFGKLDYRSGGHTQQARLTAWLGTAGIDRPGYREDTSQCFSVEDSDSERCHEDDWRKIDDAIAFLEQQQSERHGQNKPFFLYVSTSLVHPRFHTNRTWLEKIPEDSVDIPAMDPTDHPCHQYQRMTKAWRYGFEEDTVRQVRRIYLAMAAEADAMVGALYNAMHRLGLSDNTYFVFSSDHGELALEHQEWYKMSFYEGSVRVPLVMTGPGIVSGQRCPNLVSLIDLCPTFLQMTGLPARKTLDGESLLPLAMGQTDKSRDWTYACFMGTTLNTSGFMLRKERWKYLVYVGYPSQLFDIQADPGELRDVIACHPDVARQLDAQLREIVQVEQTHRDVMAYNKEAFRQWRRQAQRGLYVDDSYGLREHPSSDYMTIMDNAFAGYDQNDERKVEAWLNT